MDLWFREPAFFSEESDKLLLLTLRLLSFYVGLGLRRPTP